MSVSVLSSHTSLCARGLVLLQSKKLTCIFWQEKMIPLAVEGKDIVVRAKTGSGKTAWYDCPANYMLIYCYYT